MSEPTRGNALGYAGLGLAGLAAGAVAGFYAGRSRFPSDLALMLSPSPDVEGIIDTHHHFLPDFYYDSIGRDRVTAVTPTHQPPKWSQAGDLAVMDEYKIRKAVVSAPPGALLDAPEKGVVLAARLNEFSAGMVHARPDRYAHFATLPLPDIDASLKEAVKALDTLRCPGVCLRHHANGDVSDLCGGYDPLSRYPIHLLTWRRHRAVRCGPHGWGDPSESRPLPRPSPEA